MVHLFTLFYFTFNGLRYVFSVNFVLFVLQAELRKAQQLAAELRREAKLKKELANRKER